MSEVPRDFSDEPVEEVVDDIPTKSSTTDEMSAGAKKATARSSRSKKSTKPTTKKRSKKVSTAKKSLKKSTKTSPKKSTAKKSVKKAPARSSTPKRKDGLRKPQVRILNYLVKQKKPRTRSEISEGADVDLAMLNSYIGSHDDSKRAANDKANYPCLRTLKLVKVTKEDIDGRDTIVHVITVTGKKAVSK